MTSGTILIDTERCKGCTLCVVACPKDLIAIDEKTLNAKGYHPVTLVDNENQCTGCAICAVMCPDAAITVLREPRPHRTAAIGDR